MKLLHDLRRRRVFRLAGLYIVGAWVVVQVAEALFQAWGIPETANRFVFIAAALCFPIALVFGWIYDITSEGIVRTRKAGADESVSMQLQTADYGILAALVAIGVIVVLGSFERIQEEIESGPAEAPGIERLANSIAVLPFTNLDIDAQTGYFSDGVSEEILQRLSTIGVLQVLASNSSFGLREHSHAEVSNKLGVSYLLEGSIRREADLVRITVRLLDHSGYQLWSDTYEREMKGIFAVQAEIAQAVSEQVIGKIVPLHALSSGRTTVSMEAYNAYLLGRHETQDRVFGWMQRARKAFEKAIELDPGYAPPYAGLATSMVVNSDRGPHWDAALELATKSLELDPDLAEGHAIAGLIKSALGDRAAGRASLERAIELDPSHSTAYSWLWSTLRAQGKTELAAQTLDQGLEIDPYNPILVVNAAWQHSYAGNFEYAERLWLRLMDLRELSGASSSITDLYDTWGRYAAKLKVGKSMLPKLSKESGQWAPLELARTYAKLGMIEEADYWQAQAKALVPEVEGSMSDALYLYRLYDDSTRLEDELTRFALTNPELNAENDPSSLAYGALAQARVGNFKVAVDWFDEALDVFYKLYDLKKPENGFDVELYLHHWPDTLVYPVAFSIAHAYQETGRDADAAATLIRVAEGLNGFRLKDPQTLEWAALHRALSGDIDASYEFLSAAVDIGWANYYEAANDPAWATAWQDDRMAGLLDVAKDRVAEQRKSVEALEQEDDFRATFERWLNR